eukprot:3102094-Amphidinium_carterae.1
MSTRLSRGNRRYVLGRHQEEEGSATRAPSCSAGVLWNVESSCAHNVTTLNEEGIALAFLMAGRCQASSQGQGQGRCSYWQGADVLVS